VSIEIATPAKRTKLENQLALFGSSMQFSDDEDDETAPLPLEERHLTPKERIVKENVEARLAFYSKREQLQDVRSVNEKRDKRARLTIAPCPIFCTKQNELPLSSEEIASVLNKMERFVTVAFVEISLLNYFLLRSEAIVSGDCPVLKTVLQSYNALSASEADIFNATLLIQMISEAKFLGLTAAQLHVILNYFCE